jgi:uncharacterized protein YecE (DUF72 family)
VKYENTQWRKLAGGDLPRFTIYEEMVENMMPQIYLGCAGWSLSSPVTVDFPKEGTHLQRYAQVFNAVEINSSFYRSHLPETYSRWRSSVPPDFRFSVKMPRTITHERKLANVDDLLKAFIGQIAYLEEKLGCMLVQLPPSLAFEQTVAAHFFDSFLSMVAVSIVCEPRHASWFSEAAFRLLSDFRIAYVIADPPVNKEWVLPPAGRITYYRLHGHPEMYHSRYSDDFLTSIAVDIKKAAGAPEGVWCIFDNTASGHAVPNALDLRAHLFST